ncbi:hypothetical protein NC651_035876 [Populus alba x Populus x berolinensis]|nr:hypothetical protein NC651_035876 [Populus alba x Populus x berolinensis]
MCLRINEASIPVSDKIYYVYPKCSALMLKNEVSEYAKSAVAAGLQRCGLRRCRKCQTEISGKKEPMTPMCEVQPYDC